MQLRQKNRQAGETLIEVLLALSIFGAAAVTIMRAMDSGLSQMFVSGQQSQVQAQLRGQVAMLQAAHDAEFTDPTSTAWEMITLRVGNKTAPVRADGCTYSANKNRLYFAAGATPWLTPQLADVDVPSSDTPVSSQSLTPRPDGSSLWIEGEYTEGSASTGGRGYYDFYVKSCWETHSVDRQQKSVIRLYDTVAPGGG